MTCPTTSRKKVIPSGSKQKSDTYNTDSILHESQSNQSEH